MGKIAMGFRKALLILVVAVLGVVSVPTVSALALAAADPTPPPATLADQRLEQVWARLQADHARMAVIFDFADQRIARMQQLIDRAKANGKNVNDLQAALDNLQNAVKQARPIFESTNGVIASHQGFDADGNVTDTTTALQTVKDLAGKYEDIRTTVQPALQAFRQAVQGFRQTNSPAPTPSS
jgi:DNA repair ATPase RecN